MAARSSSTTANILGSFHFSPTPKPRPEGRRPPPPPIVISTTPSHVTPLRLRDLLRSCDHSPHRFPATGADGRPEPADVHKLRLALDHSFVVVSVFCRPKFWGRPHGSEVLGTGLDQVLERALPVPGSGHQLVIPSLRRRGIGRKIIERIIRVLTSRGIYDISALCKEKDRLFFEACGFDEDHLGSTTMTYTQSAPDCSEDNMVRSGHLSLVPPHLQSKTSNCIAVCIDTISDSKLDFM